MASGFFEDFQNPEGVDLPEPKGMMRGAYSERVEGSTARKLARFVTTQVALSREQKRALYGALIELMTNTNGHAAGDSDAAGSPNWFASVYCRDGVAYLSFIDLGVGILESLSARSWRRRFRGKLAAHRLPPRRVSWQIWVLDGPGWARPRASQVAA